MSPTEKRGDKKPDIDNGSTELLKQFQQQHCPDVPLDSPRIIYHLLEELRRLKQNGGGQP
jgi:hypothetical protein